MQDCKYKKEQKIVSYNGGVDWQNVMPEEFRKGDLIEADSQDCASIETMYRWRLLDGIFMCEDNVKYEKEVMEESYDNGLTWYSSYPTQYRKGSQVGYDADYCDYKGQGHYDVEPLGPTHCPSGTFWDGFFCRDNSYNHPFDPMKNTKCSGENTVITTADTKYRTITGYTTYLRSYSIGSCTTEIGYGAFSGQTSLTSCTFEADSQLTTIGDYAFRNCTGLTSFNIPSGVTTIGSNAFSGCYNLASMNIPASVTTIGSNAFGGCEVTAYTVNAAAPPTLGTGALSGAYGYKIYVPCTSVSLYKSASGWSDYASKIYGIPPCEIVYKIITTNTQYGDTLFIDCNSSSTLTRAETYEVEMSSNYTAVVGSCVTVIADDAFSRYTKLREITLPNTVTAIGNSVFSGCGLTSIDIPNSITSIGNYAFDGCTHLTSCTISTGVTTIGDYAFRRCSGLTSVTIPTVITSIGDYAFQYCRHLTGITVLADEPPTLGNYAFNNTNNCPIYVPYDAVDKFKGQWSDYASRIQPIPKWIAIYQDSHTESAECDASSAITQNEISLTNLVSVQIGNCVTEIGGRAFYGSGTLAGCIMPNSITSIASNAFRDCSGLTSIDIPNSVTSIGSNAFRNCSSLTNVVIPSSVTSIDFYAFRDCSGLTSVTVEATTPPTSMEYSYVFNDTNDCPIYVPSGSVNAYKTATGWSDYASRIQAIT